MQSSSQQLSQSRKSRWARLIRIISLLKTQPYVKLPELLSILDVSKSQFYKDKELLAEDFDFIFEFDRVSQRWRINREPFLSLDLEVSEIFALMMAVRQISANGDYVLSSRALNAMEKIVANASDQIKDMLTYTFEGMTLQEGFGCDPTVIEQLQEAVAESRCVKLWHRSPDDEVLRECLFEPYILFFRKRALYIDGFRPAPEEYRGYRVFRANRIERVQLLGMRFERHNDYRFEERWRHVYRLFGAGQTPVSLKLRFSAHATPYIREVRWHPSMQVELLEQGGCLLTLEVADYREVLWELISWKPEVLEPPEARSWMQDWLQSMNRIYGVEEFPEGRW